MVIARRLAETDHHRDVASRLRALLKTERESGTPLPRRLCPGPS